ncbi:hypothetical protein D3C81_1597510 [compost metagenome]
MTGSTARKNSRSPLRSVTKPLAGTLAEQPLRLAPNPAVARKALAPRLNLSNPRRDSAGVSDRLGFILVISRR